MGGLRDAGHTSGRVALEKAATQEDVRIAFEELSHKELLHLSIFADFKAQICPSRQQAMVQREGRVQALSLWRSPKHHQQCDKERPGSLQCSLSGSNGLPRIHDSRDDTDGERARGEGSENTSSDRAVVSGRHRSRSGYLVFEARDERSGNSIGPGYFQNGVRDHCEEDEKKACENERTGSGIT